MEVAEGEPVTPGRKIGAAYAGATDWSEFRAVDNDETRSVISGPLTPGERIGAYRLIQRVGEGGMGVVWEAEQETPVRRIVALKLIRRGMDTADVVARFESERQALALMNHPGIARVFDGGATADGRPYFAMELVPGAPITEYCDRNRVAIDERLELFVHVCEAVQHAHQKGIIHRDLKPSNVLVTMQDGQPVPKIIDFGVAKATSQRLTDRPLHTQYGSVIGTPVYMSPEQFESGGIDIDTRSDVYSLGALLYELLTGNPPFGPEEGAQLSFDELRHRILEVEPPRPSSVLRTLPPDTKVPAERSMADGGTLSRRIHGDLDWIVLKALAKDRTRRYASVSELGADILRHGRREPVSAGPPSGVYRLRKFVSRHRVGVGAAAALVAAVLLGIAGTTVGLVRARRAESEALREAEVARQVSDFLVGIFEVSDPNEARGNTITAREVLDKGAKAVRAKLEGQPLVKGRFMGTIGMIYRNLGLYPEASSLLEEAQRVLERDLGPNDVRTIEAKRNLASALVLAGEIEKARPLMGDLLKASEKAYGPDAPETARTLNTIAGFYITQEDYRAAVPVLERCLAIREKTLGPTHPDVSKTLNNLGHARMGLRDLEGARRDFERALAVRMQAFGPDHPETARILTNLGMLALERKDPAEARRFLTQALGTLERALGPVHPDVVETRRLLDLASK